MDRNEGKTDALHRPQRPVEPHPHDGGDVLLGKCFRAGTLHTAWPPATLSDCETRTRSVRSLLVGKDLQGCGGVARSGGWSKELTRMRLFWIGGSKHLDHPRRWFRAVPASYLPDFLSTPRPSSKGYTGVLASSTGSRIADVLANGELLVEFQRAIQ
ncbi:hypothetical protein B0H14DRAFT_2599180 [Mycena olivaceomarginata]|nr:hypothetical protein B0H14DRAFT_2599180 [Mycena olivaceomarginata]